MEVGRHVRVLVEEAPKPEGDPAIILIRLMMVVLAVDHRQILKVATHTLSVQVRNQHNLFSIVKL